MGELHQHIQSVFTAECAGLRPPASRAQQFGISRIQLYADDGTGQWADLTSAAALQSHAQLYVFQSDPNFREGQDQIPPARRPASYNVSPNRSSDPQQRSTVDVPARSASAMTRGSPMPAAATTTAAMAINPSNGINVSRHATPVKTAQQVYSSTPVPTTYSAPSPATRSAYQLGTRDVPQRSESLSGQTVASGVSTTGPYLPSMGAAFGDKIHAIFEAAGRGSTRQSIHEGDMRALFRDTNIDFAPYVISALFRQADTNRDGSISISDLHHLLKEYPTLTDALYFRLRDLQEGEVLQRRLADECVRLEENKLKREHAKAAEEENTKRIAEHVAKMKHLEGEWNRRLSMEHDISERHAAASNEAASHLQKATSHHKDLAVVLNREDAARRFLTEAEREAQYAEQQHAKAQQLAQLAAHKVKELLELLEVAKAEQAQQEQNAAECLEEVQRAKDNERKAAEQLYEYNSDLQRRKEFNETVSDSSINLQTKVSELQKQLNECQIENERLAQTIELSSEDLRRFELGRDGCRRDIAMSDASVSDSDRRIAAADQAIVIFAQRRAATEAKEKPLLEQEIRLKEQRLMLDESEVLLRREAYSVFDPMARAGAAGGLGY